MSVMIHTDIDIKDEVWNWITQSQLSAEISGSVYKDQRPLNSTLEDIVIAVIARDADRQMQEATVNVNVYVPDIHRVREAIEDTTRLRTLCTLAASVFEYRHVGNAIYELDSQEVMKANGIDWHVINNRLRVRYNNE